MCLFEPRSFLERLTTNWEYNSLLVAAAACADPADRLRYVVAFAVSGLCRQVSFHKPFNPILGETYQVGSGGDGGGVGGSTAGGEGEARREGFGALEGGAGALDKGV